MSSRHLYFFIVAWAAIAALFLVILASRREWLIMVSQYEIRKGQTSRSVTFSPGRQLSDADDEWYGDSNDDEDVNHINRLSSQQSFESPNYKIDWNNNVGRGNYNTINDAADEEKTDISLDSTISNIVEDDAKGGMTLPLDMTSPKFQCTPGKPTNFVFLKVFKSGSTTVANLLARYALRHNLNIALPTQKGRINHFPPGRFSAVPVPGGQSYNVLFNHMVYQRSSLDRLMPSNTFYFAIMREPFSRLISSLNYYYVLIPGDLKTYFRKKETTSNMSTKNASSLTSLSRLPPGQNSEENQTEVDRVRSETSFTQLLASQGLTRMQGHSELYNSLAGVTGLAKDQQNNMTAVREHAYRIGQQLHLVMVMEDFLESLVLLKRYACLDLQDLVFMPLNSAHKSHIRTFSEKEEGILRAWQAADHYLYRYLYRRFQDQLRRQDSTFWLEVEVLRGIVNTTATFCRKVPSDQETVLVAGSAWNEPFSVSGQDCRLMTMREITFQKQLLERAWNKLNESSVHPGPGGLSGTP